MSDAAGRDAIERDLDRLREVILPLHSCETLPAVLRQALGSQAQETHASVE